MPFDIHNIPLESIPRAIVRPALLAPEVVRVEHDGGELVTIHFGNAAVTMHYESALKVSQWIRVRAKQAKRRAGDVSRHWSAIGVIDDFKG